MSRPTGTSSPRAGHEERLFVAAVLAALLPLAVAAARAVLEGWVAVGDNALLAIRTNDVLTSHHPLLGLWTSASVEAGADLNHPGPLLFDLLALPAKLIGGSAGMAVAVALLNAIAVVSSALFARRLAGPLGGALTAAAAAALAWAMGSALLIEPWQPYSMLLPLLLLLVLAWSVSSGDRLALPVLAGVASLVLQTHLSYAFLVPVLVAWSLLGMALSLRADRTPPPMRAGAVALLVLVLCWAQPLVEQLTSEGNGNLTRLRQAFGEPTRQLGVERGARLVSDIVTLPPFWLRPSFEGVWLDVPAGVPPSLDYLVLPSPLATVASLAIVAALLGALALTARRAGDRAVLRLVVTGGVVLVVGVATATRAPIGFFGVPPHQYRWLWPTAVFLTLALALGLARRAERRPSGPWRLTVVALGATASFAVANLPAADLGASAPLWSVPVAEQLNARLDALEDRGTLLVDLRFTGFGDSYGPAVMAELQQRDIPFVVDDPALVRQLGPGRAFDGTNADAVLTVRTGADAASGLDGGEPVVSLEPLDGAEVEELTGLRADLSRAVDEGAVALNPLGAAAVADRGFQGLEPGRPLQEAGGGVVLSGGNLLRLVRAGHLEDGPLRAELARYADLQEQLERGSVALYLSAPPAGTS